jgi:hypothetical protein
MHRDKVSYVLTPGGVLANKDVYARVQAGDWLEYDGCHQCVLHFSDLLCFTHEFLQEFWDATCESRTTHKGWIRSKIKMWRVMTQSSTDSDASDGSHDLIRAQVRQLLDQPSLPDRILDALYDYVELLDIEYEHLFECQCTFTQESRNYVRGVYDNACKW